MDVRHIQGSFFEGLKKRAEALEVGEGLHTSRPLSRIHCTLSWEGLGYEHHTEQRREAESMSGSAAQRRRKATAPGSPFKRRWLLLKLSHDRVKELGQSRRWILGDHMAERDARTALRNAAAAVPDQRCRCGPG